MNVYTHIDIKYLYHRLRHSSARENLNRLRKYLHVSRHVTINFFAYLNLLEFFLENLSWQSTSSQSRLEGESMETRTVALFTVC